MGGSTIKFSLAVTSSSTIYVYLQGRSARLVVYVQSTSHVAAAVHKHEKKWCGYNFASGFFGPVSCGRYVCWVGGCVETVAGISGKTAQRGNPNRNVGYM
jgi:hypothetical protein